MFAQIKHVFELPVKSFTQAETITSAMRDLFSDAYEIVNVAFVKRNRSEDVLLRVSINLPALLN